jgi:hypothetical protein
MANNRTAQKRAYYLANRERILARTKAYNLAHLEQKRDAAKRRRQLDPSKERQHSWRQNGIEISYDQYQEMLEKQYGKCAICGIHQDDLSQALAVDHDHETGQVRGLLCSKCNKGLGLFQEDCLNLEKAVEYLKKSMQLRMVS